MSQRDRSGNTRRSQGRQPVNGALVDGHAHNTHSDPRKPAQLTVRVAASALNFSVAEQQDGRGNVGMKGNGFSSSMIVIIIDYPCPVSTPLPNPVRPKGAADRSTLPDVKSAALISSPLCSVCDLNNTHNTHTHARTHTRRAFTTTDRRQHAPTHARTCTNTLSRWLLKLRKSSETWEIDTNSEKRH